MEKRRKLLALFMALMLVFGVGSVGVYAFDGYAPQPQAEISTVFEEAELTMLTSESDLFLQAQRNTSMFNFEGKVLTDMSMSMSGFDRALETGMDSDMGTFSISPANTSFTQRLQGFLATPTQFQFVPFSLWPNEVVQLTLETPPVSTIDYHLHLYTFNPNTGAVGNLVAFSELATFINTGVNGQVGTVPEAIAFRHTGVGAGNYVALIFSERGSSTVHPFTLTVSFDHVSSIDSFELNDSRLQPRVQVTDSSGRPVYGAEVVLEMRSMADPYLVQSFAVRTRADGWAHFDVSPTIGGVAFTAIIGELHPHFFRHYVDVERLDFWVSGNTRVRDDMLVYRLIRSSHI